MSDPKDNVATKYILDIIKLAITGARVQGHCESMRLRCKILC